MTVEHLIEHYREHERGEHRLSKAQFTVDIDNEYLSHWIYPRRKDVRVTAIKPADVEA